MEHNWGCLKCYEVGVEFHTIKNGQKICDECGGIVLDIQEAFDHIAELSSEVLQLKDLLNYD